MMKRLIAVLLCLLLSCAWIQPSLAAFSREEWYAMGLAALEEMLPETVELAEGYFENAGSHDQAFRYKQYAKCLSDIFAMNSGEPTDISMTKYILRDLTQFTAFVESLSAQGFPSCSSLLIYIEARELERDGRYAQARKDYLQISDVLDATQRRYDLTRLAYEEGKALYEAGDYAGAAEALDGLYWEDSEELLQAARAYLEPTPTPKPVSVTKGNYITFGHYPQTASGDDNTPIEWLVLDVDEVNHRALLISRYGLDARRYNEEHSVDITWEECTLRIWLNSTFLNKAFTAQERTGILLTDVDNSSSQGYSGYSTSGGNNTQDKLFLLSYAEANKYLDVQQLSVNGSENNTKPRAAATAYAAKQGASTNRDYKTADGMAAWLWWLRSPGHNQRCAAFVDPSGALHNYYVTLSFICVRPALWIDLESDIF